MKTPYFTYWGKITIAAMLMLIFSCNAEKQLAKKEKQAKEFYQTHPTELAELCIEEFPTPDVIYIPGDTIVEYKSIIHPGVYLPCPDPTPENPNPTVKCPDCKETVKYITKTDTIRFKDLKDVQLYNGCRNEVKALGGEINELKDNINDLEKSRNNWMWIAICLGVAIIIFVLVKIFK